MSTFLYRKPTLFVMALLCCAFFGVLSWQGLPLYAESSAPASWSWQPGADLNSPRYGHTATPLPDGRVAVIGGIGAPQISKSDRRGATGLQTRE
ncbi:MAG: hypothetical protein KF893_07040 [Caldilineaceae bacterium]|nr:hypothetical protein [Caldilineaceae bacterium]